ncbi:hypothetical protein, partial [Pantoea sp. PA1]
VNLQHAGETGNMKKNQPALLTEGCIKYWGQVSRHELKAEVTSNSLSLATGSRSANMLRKPTLQRGSIHSRVMADKPL